MKNKIILLLTVILSLSSISQSYGEDEVFPKSDAIWSIRQYKAHPTIRYEPYYERWIFGLSGDTIIDEKAYNKLYLLNDTTLNIDDEDIFVAGLREADKKIWVQPADKKDGTKLSEFLMYDFSKTVEGIVFIQAQFYMGWDLKEPTFENAENDRLLESRENKIVSDEIGAWGRELFYSYGEWGAGYIAIENIGSLDGGLYFSPLRYPSGPGGPSGCMLACMKVGNQIKYISDECKECFEEHEWTTIEYEIDQLGLSFDYDRLRKKIIIDCITPLSMRLVDIEGKQLLNLKEVQEYAEIDISSFSSGVYIYSLSNNKGLTQTGKVIVY